MADAGAPQLHWFPTSPWVRGTGGGAWLLLFTMLATSAVDTGAYFVAFSTTFSFPKPPILMQERQTVRVVRRRETFDDMTSFDVQL